MIFYLFALAVALAWFGLAFLAGYSYGYMRGYRHGLKNRL